MREAIAIIVILVALAMLHPKVGEWLEKIDIHDNLGSFDD